MKFPKEKKMYCRDKKCKGHKNFKITQYKPGKASLHALGKRRYDMKQKGFGGQTKPVFKKKAKTTKKISVRCKCTVCGFTVQKVVGRCKTFELIAANMRSRKSKSSIVYG
mmetsp:Transcript_48942/g.60162  ORF Transcript_48942/g.60162 Transcript_48942/m.60162 type:complete len:110 (+) Transcript_48942:126-455(+)